MSEERMKRLIGTLILVLTVYGGHAYGQHVDLNLEQAMKWRHIGPFRGGRVTAVTGVPGQIHSFFSGAAGGGLWKTEDAGMTWNAISDGQFATGSVGAIAVAVSDPNVIYVGMGEGPPRGQASSDGDGVYKSTDGGKTWEHRGLTSSRRVPRIRIHPKNPDLVYVASQGSPWGPSEERGVYRSEDGGESWKRILFVDDKTGAVDLSMDPSNPRILYAAMWEYQRQPWKVTSGGPGSGLYKTSDGGENWEELTEGLPEGTLGKMGVAVSPADSERVWAIVEADEGGLYRSDDAGVNWRRVNSERVLFARSWYFMRVYADPVDPDTVYVLNMQMLRSTDGGKSFENVPTPHGDNHDLWIHPLQNGWMINGNDGGANVTFNGGRTWGPQDNQPTAQFYRVTTDNRFPYWVYGCQQDFTGCAAVPSRTSGTGIARQDWHTVGGGESGFVALDPDDPTLIYAGANMNQITEYDRRSGQAKNIMAIPVQGLGLDTEDLRYRFNWNAPIVASPHDYKTIYHAAQLVLKTTDGGQSWEEISPDLTRNEVDKHGAGGGPIMGEAAGGEYYNTITYLVESPHEAGTLWVGADDGTAQITRDGGASWQNVTPPGVGETRVNAIDVSPHDPATAYIVATGFVSNDFEPHIYKTSDYGGTWRSLTRGLPSGDSVRVVREDPGRKGLLYAGTQSGVYVSFNDGALWQGLKLNLPSVPVTDLVVRHNDLVASTEGRGFWILDDLSPLQQMGSVTRDTGVFLFRPRDSYRTKGSSRARPGEGENAPAGAIAYYYLSDAPEEPVRTEFRDESGTVIRTLNSTPTEAGLTRLVWDLGREDIDRVPGTFLAADFFGTVPGYRVPPGKYEVRLTVGDEVLTESLQVLKDPRVTATDAELEEQAAFLGRIRESINAVHKSVILLQQLREQVEARVASTKGLEGESEIAEAGESLSEKLLQLETRLMQPRLETIMDAVNFPTMLNEQFLFLKGAVASADAPPTESATKRFDELQAQWEALQTEMTELMEQDLARFNALFEEHGIPAIVVSPKQAIQSATLRPAQMQGVDDRLGTIAVGKLADIIVVDENPLDDISLLQYRVSRVIKGGVVYK